MVYTSHFLIFLSPNSVVVDMVSLPNVLTSNIMTLECDIHPPPAAQGTECFSLLPLSLGLFQLRVVSVHLGRPGSLSGQVLSLGTNAITSSRKITRQFNEYDSLLLEIWVSDPRIDPIGLAPHYVQMGGLYVCGTPTWSQIGQQKRFGVPARKRNTSVWILPGLEAVSRIY